MWGLKGMLGKIIVMVASGSGIGAGGLSKLLARGGYSTDKRVAQVKAGWGKDIYQKARDTQLTQMNGRNGEGWTITSKEWNVNEKSGANKYKWNGEWKYLGKEGDKKYWILSKDNECWGLVVQGNKSGDSGKVSWRVIKGKKGEEKCLLNIERRGKKWENGNFKKENVSASLDR